MKPASDIQTSPALSFTTASVGVLIASIGFGLAPFFAKSLTDSGLAAHAVPFYRFLLAACLLWPILLPYRREWPAVLWGVASGAVMGVGWTGYVLALDAVSVSTAGVLYMTYPVFTILIAWALFADQPRARSVLASLIIVAAAALASGPAAIDAAQLPYVLIALTAPFGFGFSIAVLVHRLTSIPPLGRIAAASLGAVAGLAPLMATSPIAEVVPQRREDWMLIFGIAVATAVAPQLIYVYCAPRIGAARTAALGSIELPTIFLVGLIAFGEAITAAQALACGLIVAAIVLSSRDR